VIVRNAKRTTGKAGVAACLAALVVLGFACREGEPTGEPKTPPNSPLPKIERKDDRDENKPAPSPIHIGDAG
jgi:hypothetical protein